MDRVQQKWRPRLVLVLGGSLAGLLGITYLGLILLRYLVPWMGWKMSVGLIGMGIFAIAVVMAWLLARLILRPVQALAERAQAMTQGQTNLGPLPHYGTQEIRDMGQSVMDMGTALHRRAEELETYSQHITHELRSPLTSIQGAAELLAIDTLPQVERAGLIATIGASAARMEDLLTSLRGLAQAGVDAPSPWSDHADMAAQVAADVGLPIRLNGPLMLPLNVRSAQVVLTHLAKNAAQAGATVLEITPQNGGYLIDDDGAAITQKNADRVFDPFFTTRREEGGTGMGLAIVQRILSAAGGRIQISDDILKSKFIVTF